LNFGIRYAFDLFKQVNCMAIFPDKSCLAVGGFQHVSIYDTMSNNPHAICQLEGTTKNTIAIGFQEDGNWMFTAGEDKALRIWDMRLSAFVLA
jgi:G protein beta subunit-like protein